MAGEKGVIRCPVTVAVGEETSAQCRRSSRSVALEGLVAITVVRVMEGCGWWSLRVR